MKPNALMGSLAALLSFGAAAQPTGFDPGFGSPVPGMSGTSPLPPFLTDGLGATTLGDRVPGVRIGGIGVGIDPVTLGIGASALPTRSVGIGSLQPDGLRADLFGRLPNLTGSGMLLGTATGSSGLLDFLTTPPLEDPFLTNPRAPRLPTLGGSSPGATGLGGGIFDDPFCRPEDFTC